MCNLKLRNEELILKLKLQAETKLGKIKKIAIPVLMKCGERLNKFKSILLTVGLIKYPVSWVNNYHHSTFQIGLPSHVKTPNLSWLWRSLCFETFFKPNQT